MKPKEMLENAIKIASLKGYRYVRNEPIQGAYRTGMWNDLHEVLWNPLVNDGDAFRLLAELSNFEPYKSKGYFPVTGAEENLRLAVTVAAATVGKGLASEAKPAA